MKAAPKTIAGIAVFLLALGWLLSPYLTAFKMKRAIAEKDAIALSEHIDFPAIRDSLKSHFFVTAMGAKEKSSGMEIGLGALVQGVASSYIDAYLSREGLAAAMRDAKDNNDLKAATFGLNDSATTRLQYETPNRFSIALADSSDGQNKVVYVMTRSGLFDWKLTSVRMAI